MKDMQNKTQTANESTNNTGNKEGLVVNNKEIMKSVINAFFSKVTNAKNWLDQQTIILLIVLANIVAYFDRYTRNGRDCYGALPSYSTVRNITAALVDSKNNLLYKLICDDDIAQLYDEIERDKAILNNPATKNKQEITDSLYMKYGKYGQAIHGLFFKYNVDNDIVREKINEAMYKLVVEEKVVKLVLVVKTNMLTGTTKKYIDLTIVKSNGKYKLADATDTKKFVVFASKDKKGVQPNQILVGIEKRGWEKFFPNNVEMPTLLSKAPYYIKDYEGKMEELHKINKAYDNVLAQCVGRFSIIKFLTSPKQGFINTVDSHDDEINRLTSNTVNVKKIDVINNSTEETKSPSGVPDQVIQENSTETATSNDTKATEKNIEDLINVCNLCMTIIDNSVTYNDYQFGSFCNIYVTFRKYLINMIKTVPIVYDTLSMEAINEIIDVATEEADDCANPYSKRYDFGIFKYENTQDFIDRKYKDYKIIEDLHTFGNFIGWMLAVLRDNKEKKWLLRYFKYPNLINIKSPKEYLPKHTFDRTNLPWSGETNVADLAQYQAWSGMKLN